MYKNQFFLDSSLFLLLSFEKNGPRHILKTWPKKGVIPPTPISNAPPGPKDSAHRPALGNLTRSINIDQTFHYNWHISQIFALIVQYTFTFARSLSTWSLTVTVASCQGLDGHPWVIYLIKTSILLYSGIMTDLNGFVFILHVEKKLSLMANDGLISRWSMHPDRIRNKASTTWIRHDKGG